MTPYTKKGLPHKVPNLDAANDDLKIFCNENTSIFKIVSWG